jgi:hypothetical protein
MLLEACNQCIKAKENWLVAMRIVFAARNHLHRSFIPENEVIYDVVMDELHHETKPLPDLGDYDHSIYNMQNALRKHTILLSRLMWRFDINDLPCLARIHHSGDNTIPWRNVSFKILRKEMIQRFQSQPKLKLNHEPKLNVRSTTTKPTPLLSFGGVHYISSQQSSPFTPLAHNPFKFNSDEDINKNSK